MAYKFDFHVHSEHSYDCNMSVKKVVETALKRGLSGIAVVDHDNLQGSIEVRKYVEEHKLPLKIILGQELYINDGEILALFINKPIISKVFSEVVKEVKNQGGLLVLPHPYRNNPKLISHIHEFDLVEINNSRTSKERNLLAEKLAKDNNSRILVGSDAHWPHEIGKNLMVFENGDDIKGQLKAGKYKQSIKTRNPVEILLSKAATVYLKGGATFLIKKAIKWLFHRRI